MIKTVIFDLDGTLLNTLEGLKNSVNFALRQFNYDEKTLDEIRSFIGDGVRQLIIRSIPSGNKNPNFEQCLKIFKANYTETMSDVSTPYPQIIKLLEILKKKNIKIAVVSNKFDTAAKTLCQKYFNNLVDITIGEGPNCKPKPSADGIEKAIKELQAQKDTTLYIGDSEVDVQAAYNANLKFIGVSWGFRDTEQIKTAGANFIIDTPLQLLDFIN